MTDPFSHRSTFLPPIMNHFAMLHNEKLRRRARKLSDPENKHNHRGTTLRLSVQFNLASLFRVLLFLYSPLVLIIV